MTTIQTATAAAPHNEGVIPAGMTNEKLQQIYSVSQRIIFLLAHELAIRLSQWVIH